MTERKRQPLCLTTGDWQNFLFFYTSPYSAIPNLKTSVKWAIHDSICQAQLTSVAELELESPVTRVSVFLSCHPISRFNIRSHPLQISKALHTKMASCLWKCFLVYWELVTKSHLNQYSVTSCASYLQSRQSLEFTQRSSGTTSRWLFSKLTLALTVNLTPALLPSDLICWVRLNSITILWARIQVAGWRVSEAFSDWVLHLIALRDGKKILSINSCWISVTYQFGCVFCFCFCFLT